jgi:hypothetical protein
VQDRPTFLEPSKAAEAIRAKIGARPSVTLTVADAAAQTGLPLRDAENGLKWLSTEFRGQLRVTEGGELVHVFANGFRKPWEGRETRRRYAQAVARGLMGALRFVVRAWVTIVLVSYALLFVALFLALTLARQGDGDRRSNQQLPGGELAYVLFRVLGDALFWTFHPWSPFSVYGAQGWGTPGYAGVYGNGNGNVYAYGRGRAQRPPEPKVPLYERVNRFFFGPPVPPEDPRANERLLVAAIRAGKGRIGLADVMRVTGLPREQADPLMAKLMLDYDGDVGVSEEGGIFYSFPAVRKTAEAASATAEPSPAWSRVKPLPPLTGNSTGANVAVAGLNAFNLFMGGWAIANGLTLERVSHLFDRVPHPFVDTGLPIALGVVPLAFSALLFLLPLGRALARPLKLRAAEEEKARLAVLREVLDRVRAKQPVTDEGVAAAWRRATGSDPPPKRVDRELVELGGDVAVDPEGGTRWRFADLETEAAAVAAEREAASEEEARLGKIVYATDE